MKLYDKNGKIVAFTKNSKFSEKELEKATYRTDEYLFEGYVVEMLDFRGMIEVKLEATNRETALELVRKYLADREIDFVFNLDGWTLYRIDLKKVAENRGRHIKT